MWIAVLDTLFFVVCFSEEPSGVADDVNNDNGNGNNEGVRSQETGEGEGTGGGRQTDRQRQRQRGKKKGFLVLNARLTANVTRARNTSKNPSHCSRYTTLRFKRIEQKMMLNEPQRQK